METTNRKRIVVVLGMHRSGTSALSRGLQVMGVELGDKLMPPNQDVNAKGFWEDIDLNALNIEMLHALGSDWHRLTPINDGDVELLHKRGYTLRAAELLSDKSRSVPIFGLKDPRMAKLLPFWEKVFAQDKLDVSYVLALRHPLSVVRSLQKRDGLSAVKCYVLWLEHVISSMMGTCGARRVIVDFDLLMHSPGRELHRIADTLDLNVDESSLESYKADFLDHDLRHTIYDLHDLTRDPACPSLVREVYETLLGVASGQIEDNAHLQKMVEQWAQEFERTTPILGLIDELAAQNEKLGDRITHLTSHVLGQEKAIKLHQAHLDFDEQTIAEYQEQASSLLEQCSSFRMQADAVNQRVTQLEAQVSELTDETVRRGKWALDLDRQLRDAQERLRQITVSNSWRITRPLRELRRWTGNPTGQARRYAGGAARSARQVYARLPLSAQTRAGIRGVVSRYFPWVFRVGTTQYVSAAAQPESLVIVPPLSDCRAAARQIELRTSAQPLVSIIIPVYGQCEYTLRCLLSIAANEPSIPYEVIVVDDCSPDDSSDILQNVNNILLIHNETNQGFIRSCNAGAKQAKGSFVYFLNNDTQVTAGWLDELVTTFDAFPGTGLVGSKLIYPNGSLQEAGGIIWRDGSAWNFGRNQDPSLPIYNYAREVDYCSGASIMIPKDLFDHLRGFDEHYLPAYCEDADLALKIRDRGYRVIYQPLSVVVHFEGITSGTDTSKGVKAYQVDNSKKMFERWRSRLQMHQLPGTDVDAAKDRCATRRVLVLDHCTPTPDQDAGSVTVHNLLLLLREMKFQVTFIPEHNFLYMPKYTQALQRAGVEVLYAPYVTTVEQHLRDHGQRYELVFIFRPGAVESNLSTVRKYAPGAKVLFHTVDLHYLRMAREAELSADPAKQAAAMEMKRRELTAIRAVDASIVHSTAELELLRPELPDEKIYVFPLILDVVGSTKPFKDRRDIVFVGGYQHLPNVDAVTYFVAEVMPILRKHLPGVRFHVVGSKPPAEVLALAAEDVVIAGFVEDLNSLLDKMRVSVAPLRYGAGIKGKIGTAMAVGLPIVATQIAAEGMSLSDGENILIADGPDAFAQAVTRLYQDESLWAAISEASVKFADSAWGAEAAWRILAMILGELAIDVTRDARPLKLYSNQGK